VIVNFHRSVVAMEWCGCWQVEGDGADVTGWTTAIHTACAASLARHLNRDSTIRLLQAKMRQQEISIDLVRRCTLYNRLSDTSGCCVV